MKIMIIAFAIFVSLFFITCQNDITCWQGTYLYNSSCLNCIDGCKFCIDGTAQGCQEWYYQPNSCEQGKYLNGNKCLNCSKDCRYCTGPLESQCYQYYWEPTDCYQGRYLEKTTKKCELCVSGCKNCTGPDPTQCLERYFIPTNCYEGNYLTSDKYCMPCSFMCQQCSGPSQVECNKFYPEGDCNWNGYWKNPSLPELPPFGQCQKCNQTQCQTCDGPNEIDCLLFYPTDPFFDCGLAYFMNKNNSCERCIKFNSQCLKCNGTKFEDCSMFQPLDCNPIGQFFDNSKDVCGNCIQGCKTCNGYEPSECSECMEGYIKNEDQTCKQCAFNCQVCKSVQECLVCNEKYYLLSNGQCDSCSSKCNQCKDNTWGGCTNFMPGTLTKLQMNLKTEADTFYFTYNPQSISLISDFKISGNAKFIVTNQADLVNSMNEQSLPQEIQNKLEAIAFMENTQFKGFSFKVQNSDIEEQLYVGSARSNADIVQYAIVQADVSGTLVPQYRTDCEQQESCSTCWKFWKLFRCCDTKTVCHQVPIGYTTDQLAQIQNAISSQSSGYIMKQLENPPADFQKYGDLPIPNINNSEISVKSKLQQKRLSLMLGQNSLDLLRQNLKLWIANLTMQQEKETSEIIYKINGTGYQTFQQSTTIQKSMGVYNKFQDQFLQFMLKSMQIPSNGQAQLQEMINQVISGQLDDWIVFSLMFNPDSQDNSNCQYVCILGRNDNVRNQTDWIQVKIGALFKLAPDYFVERNCKQTNITTTNGQETISQCSINYIEQNHEVSDQDTQNVFNYFELIAFKQIQYLIGDQNQYYKLN